MDVSKKQESFKKKTAVKNAIHTGSNAVRQQRGFTYQDKQRIWSKHDKISWILRAATILTWLTRANVPKLANIPAYPRSQHFLNLFTL